MNIYPLIQAYGLQPLLTEQDDPALWEAVLHKYWLSPQSAECMVSALCFNIGRRLMEGELPNGEANEQHAKMRGMVDIEEWYFVRVDEAQLSIQSSPQNVATLRAPFPGAGLAALMAGQFTVTSAASISSILGVSRPSRNAGLAVVYCKSSVPGAGEGNAYLWQRQQDGQWQPTDRRVAWWIT